MKRRRGRASAIPVGSGMFVPPRLLYRILKVNHTPGGAAKCCCGHKCYGDREICTNPHPIDLGTVANIPALVTFCRRRIVFN